MRRWENVHKIRALSYKSPGCHTNTRLSIVYYSCGGGVGELEVPHVHTPPQPGGRPHSF